jgi:hypothetical protein
VGRSGAGVTTTTRYTAEAAPLRTSVSESPSYYQRLLLVTVTRVLSDPHVQGVVASSAVADRFSYTGRWRETLSAQACREGEGNVSRTDCY